MRILHVVEVDHGGVVSYVAALASRQAGRGHQVEVLAPRTAPPVGVKTSHWSFTRRAPTTWIAGARELQSLVRDGSFDVVHLHSFFPGLVGRVLKLSGAVVYQPHSWAFAAVPKALRFAVAWIERGLASRCSAIVVNCSDEREEGRRYGIAAKMTPVSVPIDTDYYSPAAADQTIDLLCVGRLSAQKAQVRLAAEWERRRPDQQLNLVFVGPGDPADLAEAAPKTFGKSLQFAGPSNDVRNWYRMAKVVVIPSRYEGQSVAMGEAMACGVPVISTEVNGAAEAVVEGDSPAGGYVTSGQSMSELLDVAINFVGDASGRQKASSAARARALTLFGAEEVVDRVESVYIGAQSRREA